MPVPVDKTMDPVVHKLVVEENMLAVQVVVLGTHVEVIKGWVLFVMIKQTLSVSGDGSQLLLNGFGFIFLSKMFARVYCAASFAVNCFDQDILLDVFDPEPQFLYSAK